MKIAADETPEDVIESQGWEIEELNERVAKLEWAQDDATALADSVRRTHNMEHSTPWRWCESLACRLVREHDLD